MSDPMTQGAAKIKGEDEHCFFSDEGGGLFSHGTTDPQGDVLIVSKMDRMSFVSQLAAKVIWHDATLFIFIRS
jgi:hypothetical protein